MSGFLPGSASSTALARTPSGSAAGNSGSAAAATEANGRPLATAAPAAAEPPRKCRRLSVAITHPPLSPLHRKQFYTTRATWKCISEWRRSLRLHLVRPAHALTVWDVNWRRGLGPLFFRKGTAATAGHAVHGLAGERGAAASGGRRSHRSLAPVAKCRAERIPPPGNSARRIRSSLSNARR